LALEKTFRREVVLPWENSPEAVIPAYLPDGDLVEAAVRYVPLSVGVDGNAQPLWRKQGPPDVQHLRPTWQP
jgi:hypothetical protein